LFSQSVYLPQVRTEFENGAVQSRARATSARRIFILGWHALSNANYETLVTFFEDYQGTTFVYTHPVTAGSYTCRFSEDALPPAKVSGWRSGTECWELTNLKIEEA
jgi:hypothetical protein